MPARSLRRVAALAAALAVGVLGSGTAASAVPTVAGAARAGTEPLDVTIGSLTPGVVPRSGPIQISGEVTNDDTETWTSVTLYSFISATPMTTAAELDAALEVAPDAVLGDRVVDTDASYTIEEIAPGDTVQYSFEVPRSLLAVSEPGVYWFGVHALGQGPDGYDLSADGRARTFLPLVARRTTPLPTAVVVPLRRQLTFAPDGSLADVADWADVLSSGGRLRSLVDLGLSAGDRPITYLVDPALVAAVEQLAAGNPARSLAPTKPPGGQGGDGDQGDGDGDGSGDETASPDPSASDDGADPGSDPGDGDDPSDGDEDAAGDEDAVEPPALDPATLDAQAAAVDWLDRLSRALPGHEVLGLPYGDVDVAAAADHSPRTYAAARRRTGDTLAPFGVRLRPAVASPGGYLDSAALDLADPGDTVLVSDAMWGPDVVAPTVVTDGPHRMVVTSTAALSGPGPGPARSSLSLRQQVLAQAAVRALLGDPVGDPAADPATDPATVPQPLVVVLPTDWNPVSVSGFFAGLDSADDVSAGVDLQSVGEVAERTPTPVSLDALAYPASQVRTELADDNFTAADDLAAAGGRLDGLLTRNDTVSRAVADQALTTVSYTSRARPSTARVVAQASTRWVDDQLAKVQVETPRAVTMTGRSGRFTATVTNELDQPVTVGLRAQVSDGVTITRARKVRVPAAGEVPGRTRVLLEASAPTTGVHQVTIALTDVDGDALGGSDQLTIRSLQLSGVIWVIFGAAGVVLFGAIAWRLVQRVRGARRAGPQAAG